jgi:hypothetical protein
MTVTQPSSLPKLFLVRSQSQQSDGKSMTTELPRACSGYSSADDCDQTLRLDNGGLVLSGLIALRRRDPTDEEGSVEGNPLGSLRQTAESAALVTRYGSSFPVCL